MKKLFTLCFLLWPMLAQATSVTILWTDNSTNEDGFSVEQKRGMAAYAEVGRVGKDVSTFMHEVTEGDLCYRVFAFNASGKSAYSNDACMSLLNAPTDVKVKVLLQMELSPTPPPTGRE